jgi:(2Fe-2S) ferredoxin
MGKRRKLRKQMCKRDLDDAIALVVCVGKKCCSRAESRSLVEAARTYAAATHARLPIVTVGCLHVCKNGPIAATYPKVRFEKHVSAKRARKLVDKLERRAGR